VDTLRLVARPSATLKRLPHPWVDLVLDEIGRRVQLPVPLHMPVFGDILGADGAHAAAGRIRPTLGNEVRLSLDPDAHVREAVLVQRSMSDADAALLAAIRDADSVRALPLPIDGDRPISDRVVLFLSLSMRTPDKSDTLADQRAARDVAVLTLPVYGDARGVMPTAGTRGPHYPIAERNAGLEGEVQLEYVVDDGGSVAPGTLRILAYTRPAFASAVYDFLSSAHFQPATIRGCPVRQLVSQPFRFYLRH
jgi:TonB family protein